MRIAQAMKKKANLTKANLMKKNQNQATRKKTKAQRKKLNLKLWMKRKRRNFQKHNGFIKFTCLKYQMELTEKLL